MRSVGRSVVRSSNDYYTGVQKSGPQVTMQATYETPRIMGRQAFSILIALFATRTSSYEQSNALELVDCILGSIDRQSTITIFTAT